jgi:signal transduction histidine kinase
VVSVRDTGKGIGEQAIRSVFDPFYTARGNGLGLGLPISRSIIEAHGGRLSAADNPGAGATFSFSLPVMERKAQHE